MSSSSRRPLTIPSTPERSRSSLEALAEWHQLVSAGDVAATQSELIRLRGALDT
jgi:hypothetical protein